MSEVTRLLSALDLGDPRAADDLLPLVYDELRKLAAARLAHERPGQTLQATALVHEAYLRLVRGSGDREQVSGGRVRGPEDSEASPSPDACPLSPPSFDSRRHFFAAAAEAMRRILVENARRKDAHKNGGGFERHDVVTLEIAGPVPPDEVLAVNEALDLFEQHDAVAARLVKLRYFSGLTLHEAAEVLELSPRTADRIWVYARTWLYREIKRSLSAEASPLH